MKLTSKPKKMAMKTTLEKINLPGERRRATVWKKTSLR
jgi:hypothetical protein